jgi:hypothetical protein
LIDAGLRDRVLIGKRLGRGDEVVTERDELEVVAARDDHDVRVVDEAPRIELREQLQHLAARLERLAERADDRGGLSVEDRRIEHRLRRLHRRGVGIGIDDQHARIAERREQRHRDPAVERGTGEDHDGDVEADDVADRQQRRRRVDAHVDRRAGLGPGCDLGCARGLAADERAELDDLCP